MKLLYFLAIILATILFTACGEATNDSSNADSTSVVKDSATVVSIKTENVDIPADTTTMKCFIAYDENSKGKPIVLVVPEWWGLNDFTRAKAKQLAENGYFALVVDMFGGGRTADNPEAAMGYAGGFYKNPKLATGRIEAHWPGPKLIPRQTALKRLLLDFALEVQWC